MPGIGQASGVYVGDWTGKVSVIRTSTDTRITSVPTGDESLSLAVSPDGTSVYACFYFGIKVINTKNHRVTATIPLSTHVDPIQILFNPNNRLAYALCYSGFINIGGGQEENLGGILQINTQTLQKTRLLWKQLPGATTVTASPDGSKLYIVDQIENSGQAMLTWSPLIPPLNKYRQPFRWIRRSVSRSPPQSRLMGSIFMWRRH